MKAKKILAVILTVAMLMSMAAVSVAAQGAALPEAKVVKLGAISADFEDTYYVYDVFNRKLIGEESDPLALNIAMQFTAKDTEEEAAASAYADYTTDYFIEVSGLEDGSVIADGCYLAGYYATYGAWVKIPLDGFEIRNGEVYPVITSVGFDYSYTKICGEVEDFICGVYLAPEVITANPDLNVKLSLGLSEDLEAAQASDFIEVGSYEYTLVDFLPEANVKNLGAIKSVDFGEEYAIYDLGTSKITGTSEEAFGLSAAMQFVAKDSAEEAAANAFADYTTDFFIVTNEDFVADGCYLAGYYPSYGTWVKIPLDGILIETEMYNPVISSVGFDFSYEDICTKVGDFVCGLYISDEVLDAHPELSVTIELGLSENLELALAGGFIRIGENYTFAAEDFGVEKAVWYEGSDAGYYWIGDEKVGMMRFLFANTIDAEDVVESGIKYILTADADLDTANGVSKTGDEAANSFYGDVTGIPEGTEGTYLAIGYIKTADDETIWSDIVECSPNFDRLFYQLSE